MAAGLAALSTTAADVTYSIQTIAGSDYVGDGGTAALAQIGSAEGLAIDSAGNLYVSDAIDHRVRKIAPGGVITTVAGTGRPGFGGDGGQADAAQLKTPYGIAVDADGNLYIADLGNFRIRKVTPGGVIRTIAGGGESVPSGDGGDATTARLNQPRNVAVDREGNVYISDFGDHRVYRIAPGGTIAKVAGTGVRGSAGDGGAAAWAQLSSPAGLAVDADGMLYIADSGNNLIRKVERGLIRTVGTTGALQATPTGIALDRAGDLYVALTGNRQIVLKLNPASGTLLTVAGTGQSGYSGDGGPALSAKLTDPRDVAVDAAGSLYVGDGRRVRVISGGTIRTFAGDGVFGFRGDGAEAVWAHLSSPRAVALDGWGNLFIADQGNYRVRKVTAAGTISTVAGGSPALPLTWPSGLASDPWGALWIADYLANRIRKVTPGGGYTTVAGTDKAGYGGDDGPATAAQLNLPAGLAADAAGNLYFADSGNHLVRKISAAGIISTIAGKGVRGRGGDGGSALSAQLDTPAAVALDGLGNLYIADSYNHSIRKVTPAGTIVTVAGRGTQGFSGDGGPATSAELSFPSGLAVDRGGNLYIADRNNHRVRKVSPDLVIATIAGNGIEGFTGDGGPAAEAQLSSPSDAAVDASGNVFVADLDNNRIRKLIPVSGPGGGGSSGQFRAVNAASLQPAPVAPGELITIYGTDLGPAEGVMGQLRVPGLLDTTLAGTQVFFDESPAALLWVGATQVNAQVPYGLARRTYTYLRVVRNGVTKMEATLPVSESAPGIFTVANGTGQALAVNEDGTTNSESNPAARGSVITLYATGEGQTDLPGVDGRLAAAPYPRPVLGVLLKIGLYPAEVLFAGSAPGFAGLLQVNARVPGGFAPAGVLALELTVGSAVSQPGVTVAVR
jgi:uncharacterized protein (TIGR03437 family)